MVHGCFVNEGEVMTQKDVITNEGCLAAEGDNDEGKKMEQQLQKIDALLQIPYEDGQERRRLAATAKIRIPGIS